jgi:hypothetical protein
MICFMRICMQSNKMKMLNGHVYGIGLLKRIHTQFNLHFYEFYANFYEFGKFAQITGNFKQKTKSGN